MKLEGKMCGTCNLWERKFATSSRTGKIIPNASCRCNAAVKLDPKLPYSIQRVSTLCEDGISCPTWEDFGEDIEMVDP